MYVLTEFLQFLVFTNVNKFLVVKIPRKGGEKGAKDTYFGTSIRGGEVLRLMVPVGVDVAEAHEGSESRNLYPRILQIQTETVTFLACSF